MAEEIKSEETRDDKLASVLEGLNETIEKIRSQPAAQASASVEKADKPVTYTRAQLKQYVDAGQIDEDQMQVILDQQRERDIEARLIQKFEKDIGSRTKAQKIESRIKAYIAVKPELSDPKSEATKALKRRVDQLVEVHDADPNSPSTHALALDMEFGSPEALKPAQETTRQKLTTRTAGGSSQTKDNSKSSKLQGLPKGLRSHFESQIAIGYFKGEDDPKLIKQIDTIRERREARGAA